MGGPAILMSRDVNQSYIGSDYELNRLQLVCMEEQASAGLEGGWKRHWEIDPSRFLSVMNPERCLQFIGFVKSERFERRTQGEIKTALEEEYKVKYEQQARYIDHLKDQNRQASLACRRSKREKKIYKRALLKAGIKPPPTDVFEPEKDFNFMDRLTLIWSRLKIFFARPIFVNRKNC